MFIPNQAVLQFAPSGSTSSGVKSSNATLSTSFNTAGQSAVQKQVSMIGPPPTAKTINLNEGIEQFSRAEREQIEYALVSGDTTGLTQAQLAWLNTQIGLTEDRILADMTDEQAALLGLQEDTAAQQEALYLEQQIEIEKQKKKQMAIYGVVGLAGLGLIAFLVKK